MVNVIVAVSIVRAPEPDKLPTETLWLFRSSVAPPEIVTADPTPKGPLVDVESIPACKVPVLTVVAPV